ncbi:hypothetical protein GGS23DRAFT_247483 [Durotheca rogersii]|uniref:uncharacterized protein n=1 Tax=Durotheca rogersii TaxID=419775 RepID=UPI00221EC858|nr:uncharacterized protein GGS23DRAFT_247483 [Durotheca rogersii]KAI5860068.1 hypothetical protein GGS23DRAFT_247483 [Durotheca rogersii]
MREISYFNQEANPNTPSDDVELRLSPSPTTDRGQQSSHPMATAAAAETLPNSPDGGDRVECLVRTLSKQALIRDPRSMSPPDPIPSYLEFQQPLVSQASVPLPMPPFVTEPRIHLSSDQPSAFVIGNDTKPPQPQPQLELELRQDVISGQPMDLAPGDGPNADLLCSNVPRGEAGGRLHDANAGSDRRIEDLMLGMIEVGAQCHVQGSASSTAASGSRGSSAYLAPVVEPNDAFDSELFDSNMELEVDTNHTGQDEDGPLPHPLGLRDAGAPAGIRKFGYLKFRSSFEAAQRCANMKKNVPRMRRRPKPQRPNSATPSSPTSTSTSTSTMR